MAVKGAYARNVQIQAKFITDSNEFYLDYGTKYAQMNDSEVLASGGMTEGIISFNTTNDMNEDSATFSIVAVGTERWDLVLSPNDIVILRVNPGRPNDVKNDVIMVGMISEIKRVGSYESSSVIYQITGQSMMKALMQLKLGTLQELTSLLGTNGWMMGMGGLSGASEYLDGEGSGGNGDGDNDDGKFITNPDRNISTTPLMLDLKNYGVKGVASKTTKVVAVDKGAFPDSKNKGYIYIPEYGLAKVIAYTDDTPGLRIKSAGATVVANGGEDKPWGSVMSVDYYKTRPSKPFSGSSSTGGSGGSSQGLSLWGASASDVIQQLYDWFIVNHTNYSYGNTDFNVANYISTNFSSRAEEKLADVQPIMSWEGSFRQLMTQAQAKPFNEFYGDFQSSKDGDGQMLLTLRPTPFEPLDWNNLRDSAISIYSNDVIEESVGQNDLEAYSIFMANMPSSVMVSNISALLSYPVMFPELADRYGYSMLAVNNPYIFDLTADKDSSDDGSSSAGDADSGNLPSVSEADADKIGRASIAWGKNKNNKAYSAKNIDVFIKASNPNSRFNGHGSGFINAGKKWDIDPVILLAFGALESAWGNSQQAQASNNFFGIGAFDSNPDNGLNYGSASIDDGIMLGAKFMRTQYFDAGQKTLYSFFNNGGVHQYSTTPDEYLRIGSIAARYFKMFPLDAKKSKSLKDQANDFNLALDNLIGNKTTAKDKNDKKETESSTASKTTKKKTDTSASGSEGSGEDNASRLKQYSVMLANWYGDNASFSSGEIRVMGNPDYRIGNIVYRYDGGTTTANNLSDPSKYRIWEYYIESVSHEFSFTNGYTTTLGVTRGLDTSVDRFAHWNIWTDPLTVDQPGHGGLQFFGGGLFGEMSLADNIQANEENGGKGSNGEGSDDNITTSANGDPQDDYPAKWKNVGKDTVADSWNYYNRECVSFVAFRLDRDGRTDFSFAPQGNAGYWGELRPQYRKDKPKRGDVAWFPRNSPGTGGYGHVAYVSKVISDTEILIEEYNYDLNGNYHKRTLKKDGSTVWPAGGFLRFPKKDK